MKRIARKLGLIDSRSVIGNALNGFQRIIAELEAGVGISRKQIEHHHSEAARHKDEAEDHLLAVQQAQTAMENLRKLIGA